MIRKMTKEKIASYADIFTETFRQPPWNESWSQKQASRRIGDVMNTPGFFGLEYVEHGKVQAFIMGNENQSYDGIHCEIKEFCVAAGQRGQGIGGKLLEEYVKALDEKGIVSSYLLTARGPLTEGFYTKREFQTSDGMITMGRLQKVRAGGLKEDGTAGK